MTEDLYRIAIISDIHAHSLKMDRIGAEKIPSWVSQQQTSIKENPLTDLLRFVREETLTVDTVLCPGDIADKADDAAMAYAWTTLQSIASEMKAQLVVGTVGNHDLHSRPEPSPKVVDLTLSLTGTPVSPIPYAKIKDLIPKFPVGEEAEYRRYWSDYIAVVSKGPCRIVALNSCSTHGYLYHEAPEYTRGRFEIATEERLSKLISETKAAPINILLVHHHPQTISERQFTDQSTMIRGDSLLALLGKGKYGSWMVVHGHRHVPFFMLGPGDNDRPYVFSAGSVGIIHDSFLYPTRPPNQFYIVEFDLAEGLRRGVGLYGKILAWNWTLGVGFKPALDSDAISWGTGFGNRTPVKKIADEILKHVLRMPTASSAREPPMTVVTEDELLPTVPDLKYLMPSERLKIQALLEEMGISVGRHPRDRRKLMFVYTPPVKTPAESSP